MVGKVDSGPARIGIDRACELIDKVREDFILMPAPQFGSHCTLAGLAVASPPSRIINRSPAGLKHGYALLRCLPSFAAVEIKC